MNREFLVLINAEGREVFIAKRHIVAVSVRPNVRYGRACAAVQVTCVNGHTHEQIYTNAPTAAAACDEIMAELEDTK